MAGVRVDNRLDQILIPVFADKGGCYQSVYASVFAKDILQINDGITNSPGVCSVL